MKSTCFEKDDILSIRMSDKPLLREVSQNWHINTRYAADGTVVEIVLLDADIEAVWKPKACPPLPKTSKTKQRRLIPHT